MAGIQSSKEWGGNHKAMSLRASSRKRFLGTLLLAIFLLTFSWNVGDIFAQAKNRFAKPNSAASQRAAAQKNQAARAQAARTQAGKTQAARTQTGIPTPSGRNTPPAVKPAAPNAKSSCLLKSERKAGSTDIIEIGLEGSGEVHQTLLGEEKKTADEEGEKMEVVAGFRYEERVIRFDKSANRTDLLTLRQYDQAGMKRNYQGQIARPLLDISRKYIVTHFDGKDLTQYSPNGPLKSDQFLLINELLANTVLLDYLLPDREVKLGEEWTIPSEVLNPFLGLETTDENTVRLVLTAIVDDMAEVDLFLSQNKKDDQGNPLPSSIQGASLGASVTMDLQGKFQFDLKSKRMTWFGLMVNENRSESLVEPGLDWKGTIRIKIAPMDAPDELTDEKVQKIMKEPTDELLSLVYNGQKGPWQFRHHRDWRMIEDGEKSAALTFIEKGEGIAQCNILSNGKIDLKSMPTLESYKEELKKGLGDQFGKFVDEADYQSESGYHILLVMIDGQFEEVPFRRIYHLITDEKGYQTTIMFDIRAEFLDRFGSSGKEILESFRMITPSEEEANAENQSAAAPKETPKEGETPAKTENQDVKGQETLTAEKAAEKTSEKVTETQAAPKKDAKKIDSAIPAPSSKTQIKKSVKRKAK